MERKKIGKLNSYIHFPQSDETYPDSAVILLHGYGSNGQDLISLGQEWAPHFPSTIFISPDAPHQCEQSPMGQQWFSLNEYTRDAMEREIESAWTITSDYIDAVMDEYSLTEDRIIFIGFSQGTMMSLYTALSRDNACAGVLGYSGRLLNEEKLIQSPHKNMPIHLIHGTADMVVSADEWDSAMAMLKNNKFNVTGYTSKGLGHNIDAQGVESGIFFIRDCLSY